MYNQWALPLQQKTGQIKLSLTQEGNELVYALADTGSGISPDQMEFIFEHFRKVEQNTNKQYGASDWDLQ